MDALAPILTDSYRYYGIVGLLSSITVLLATLCVAQMRTLSRFSSSVSAIIAQQHKIIDNQDRAHDLCQAHAGIVREQVDSMRSLSFELREVVRTIGEFHRETSVALVKLFASTRVTD